MAASGELGDPAFGEWSGIDRRIEAVAERALDAVRAAGRPEIDAGSKTLTRFLDGLDDAAQRAVGMWAHRRALTRRAWTNAVELGASVARRKLSWTPEEVGWLLAESSPARAVWLNDRFGLPIAAARRLDTAGLAMLRPALQRAEQEIEREKTYALPERRRELLNQVRELLAQPEDVDVLPDWVLPTGDAFSVTVRAELGDLLTRPGVPHLLIHCVQQTKVTPTKRWTTRAVALRSAAPALPAVRALLERFCAQPERWVYRRELNLDVPVVVGEDNETLLRGVVWAVADVDEDWVTPALAAVTVHAATAFEGSPGYPHCPRLANSAVLVLAQRPGDLPVTTLSRLSLAVRNNALRSRLATALTELGALRGWSPGEVAELAVDRHGLNADGRAVEVLGEYEAVVAVDPQTAKAALSFHRDGKAVKGVPAMVKEVHGERLGALRTTVKELNGTLALERLRLDRLMSSPRDWRYQDWVSRYLDHPVTGMFARRLLWEVDADGEWCAGLPARHEGAWVLVGRAGEGMTGERVRLWHPIRATIDEIAAWRDHVLAAALRQPFKQAFREVYLLTPAEEQTGTYSNRFAGHILRYRQANALMRTRGWTSNYLGFFSSGYQGEAVKELADGQWRAMFFHELVDNRDRDDTEVRFCSTDQVRFARRDGAVWDQARVADVPPAVFSEAMRDVDLFVGVTSIAADPQWTDRGEHRFDAYWEATAFGALTATAEIRRETLARLLPSTKIASKVELGERFLRVFGTRRTYKVHLGSGNILMEPNDAYLCVVARKRSTPTLHLPFDEDPMLSVILSKAFLLAADDKITDPSIVQQLGR